MLNIINTSNKCIVFYYIVGGMETLEAIGKRLDKYLQFNNIGINELGRLTKTSGAQVSNIINGKNYGLSKLMAVLDVLPNLNPMWLLQGKGFMERENNTAVDLHNSPQIDLQARLDEAYNKIAFLEMTLEVYKNSSEILKETNMHLKIIVEHYQNANAAKQDNHSA